MFAVYINFVGIVTLLKLHGEFTAFAQRAFNAYFPARLLTNLFGNGKSESEAAVFAAMRFIHREKARKNLDHIFFRDAYARVLDGKELTIERNVYTSALLIVLNGVAH